MAGDMHFVCVRRGVAAVSLDTERMAGVLCWDDVDKAQAWCDSRKKKGEWVPMVLIAATDEDNER